MEVSAHDLTLFSSRPISSAKRLIWASKPSSLGSEVTRKGTEMLLVGRARLGAGELPTSPGAKTCPQPSPFQSHSEAQALPGPL